MSNSLTAQPARCQGQVDSPDDKPQGKKLSLMLSVLREAIDKSGWKHDALAVELGLPNAAYLSRMLSGEKPWTLKHIIALPDEIEAVFFQRWTESFGQIVVAPPESKEAAVKQFVAGLFGMLHGPALTLPETAGAPLKVALDHKKSRAGNAAR